MTFDPKQSLGAGVTSLETEAVSSVSTELAAKEGQFFHLQFNEPLKQTQGHDKCFPPYSFIQTLVQ